MSVFQPSNTLALLFGLMCVEPLSKYIWAAAPSEEFRPCFRNRCENYDERRDGFGLGVHPWTSMFGYGAGAW